MDSLYYLLFLPILYFIISDYLSKKFQKLPPSPPYCLPILGHLHLLQKPLHRTLAKIANKYGQVLFLRFGSRPVLLVSSPSAAEECLTKNDTIFANRPRLLAGKHLGYNYTTLVWSSYGHHWRNLRRIATLEILSSQRVQMYTDVRKTEVHSLILRLLKASGNGEYHTVDMKSALFEMTLNIMMRMIAGKRYYCDDEHLIEEAKRFKDIVIDTFKVSGASNVVDFLPFLKWIGVNKTERFLEDLQPRRDQFMQELIEEHRNLKEVLFDEQRNKTMVHVLLSLQESDPVYYKDEIIRGVMQVMLSAGTDTSAGTMEWALSLLLNNPEALRKARNEIDTQTAQSRLMDDSDLAQLPCLHAIIAETLRMYPAAPVLVPHESSDECFVQGFRVPRGTMLLINLWAIQNDPNLWEDPTQFKPERFMGMEGQRDGFRVMPFGYGRRGCPGENLAMKVVGLALGLLIQCFEWERPSDDLVGMSEGAGLTMPREEPLMVQYKPRQTLLNLLTHLEPNLL